MSTSALALVPVLLASTGIGANTGPAWHQGHRNHAVRENRMETRRAGSWGASRALRGLGAPLFPLFFHLPRNRQHQARGRR